MDTLAKQTTHTSHEDPSWPDANRTAAQLPATTYWTFFVLHESANRKNHPTKAAIMPQTSIVASFVLDWISSTCDTPSLHRRDLSLLKCQRTTLLDAFQSFLSSMIMIVMTELVWQSCLLCFVTASFPCMIFMMLEKIRMFVTTSWHTWTVRCGLATSRWTQRMHERHTHSKRSRPHNASMSFEFVAKDDTSTTHTRSFCRWPWTRPPPRQSHHSHDSHNRPLIPFREALNKYLLSYPTRPIILRRRQHGQAATVSLFAASAAATAVTRILRFVLYYRECKYLYDHTHTHI
jgi:hypothetical protein